MLVMRFFVFSLLLQTAVLSYKKETVQDVSKALLTMVKYKMDRIFEAAGSKTRCARDLKEFVQDAAHLKRWALEMLDASGKPPSGLLAGNIYLTGNFDQCLNVNRYQNQSGVYGQYCTVFITPSSNKNDLDTFSIGNLKSILGVKTTRRTTEILKLMKVTYGLCIPSSCSIENLKNVWGHIETTLRLPIHVHFIDSMCSRGGRSDQFPAFNFDRYVKGFFFFYTILLLLSTCYDVFIHQQTKSSKSDIWVCFSLYTNSKRLISVQDVSTEVKYLECLSGIKVLSMFWVIYCHRVILNAFSGTTNLLDVYMNWIKSVWTTFAFAGVFAVDTFLFISGLLLSYGVLNYYGSQSKRYKQVPYLVLYAYRILRLTPALAAIVLFYISIFKDLSDGPMWPMMVARLALPCYKGWFVTLLFASNFLQFNQQCVQHSWYLAVDSQLFFLSPILISGVIRNPVRTCLCCIVISLLSGIYTFFITFNNHYGATMFESDLAYHQYIYQPTVVRMPAWLIGFVFGYLVYKYNVAKVPVVVKWLAWSVVLVTMIGLVLVHLVFSRATVYDALNAALYNSGAKQVWSLALGGVVLLCTTDREGVVNRFLSMGVFRVLVKITYSAYLTHMIVIAYFIGSKRHSSYFSDVINVHDFFGDAFFTILASVVWCLAFESPFVAISRHLYKKEMTNRLNKTLAKRKKNKNKDKYILCVYKYDGEGNKKVN